MLDVTRHQEAERRMRELIREAELAPPDAVEYTPDSVVLLWHDEELAVVIDLDDEPERAYHAK
jgi:hypothetical protein